jgi:hypothetical protein
LLFHAANYVAKAGCFFKIESGGGLFHLAFQVFQL